MFVLAPLVALALCFDETPVADWLTAINPLLGQYAQGLAGGGFATARLLHAAASLDESTLLEQAFDSIKVKKPHRRLIRNRLEEEHAKHNPSGRRECPVVAADNVDDCAAMARLLGPIPFATFMDDIYQRKHLLMRGSRCKGLAIDSLTSDDLLLNLRRNQNNNNDHPSPIEYGTNFVFTRMDPGGQKMSYDPSNMDNLVPLLGEIKRVMDEGEWAPTVVLVVLGPSLYNY
jgi:hypothetical protein